MLFLPRPESLTFFRSGFSRNFSFQKTVLVVGFLIGFIQFGLSQCNSVSNFFNQFEVNLNQQTGVVSVIGLKCNFCSYAQEDMEACECNAFCNDFPTEEEEEELFECIDLCEQLVPPLIYPCQEDCLEEFQAIIDNCLEENQCGEVPTPIREPVAYIYGFAIWHNTGFTEDFSGDPNEIVQSGWITGSAPNTLEHQLATLPLPTGDPVSYCYVSDIVIMYSDGLCCRFIDQGCVLKG